MQDLNCVGTGTIEDLIRVAAYEEDANARDVNRVAAFGKFGKSRNPSVDPRND